VQYVAAVRLAGDGEEGDVILSAVLGKEDAMECETRLKALVRAVGTHQKVTVVDRSRLFSSHPARAIHCEVRAGERILYVLYTTVKFDQARAFRIVREVYRLLEALYGAQLAVVKRTELEGDEELMQELPEIVRRCERDELEELKSEVDEVKEVMQSNLEAAVARTEQLDILVDKSSGLKSEADQFRHASSEARNHFWWQNLYYAIAIGAAVLVLIIIIVLAIVLS